MRWASGWAHAAFQFQARYPIPSLDGRSLSSGGDATRRGDPVNDHRSVAAVSRRTALAGLGVCGLGLAAVSLISMPMSVLARQATPDPAETEADLIRETEHERLRSLVEADMDVAGQLHADDFQLINPSGGGVVERGVPRGHHRR